jgi:hypothetical protein
MNIVEFLVYCLIVIWLSWQSKNTWLRWQAGNLDAKNLYFVGLGWIGIIGLGVKHFS